jgi:hypothetical protein
MATAAPLIDALGVTWDTAANEGVAVAVGVVAPLAVGLLRLIVVTGAYDGCAEGVEGLLIYAGVGDVKAPVPVVVGVAVGKVQGFSVTVTKTVETTVTVGMPLLPVTVVTGVGAVELGPTEPEGDPPGSPDCVVTGGTEPVTKDEVGVRVGTGVVEMVGSDAVGDAVPEGITEFVAELADDAALVVVGLLKPNVGP